MLAITVLRSRQEDQKDRLLAVSMSHVARSLELESVRPGLHKVSVCRFNRLAAQSQHAGQRRSFQVSLACQRWAIPPPSLLFFPPSQHYIQPLDLPTMSSSRRDDHHHHHDSTRHRLSRIAGQLGAGMAPKYYRSGSSSPSSSSSSTSSSSSPADRLLSISRQLGGAVVTPTALRQGAAGAAAQQHHPHLAAPHSEAKQWERLPRYRELPTEGGFPGCAWSVWGANDQLGTLNLLTGPVVARAAKEEIRTGHSITLSWPMHLPQDAAFGRKAVEHKARGKAGPQYAQIRDAAIHERRVAGEQVEDRSEKGEEAGMPLADDELSLNLQAGSQWDGLSHFGHLSLNCYYGGRTRKQIHDSFEKPHRPVDPRGEEGPELGMQAWAQKGMQGRGVLLDVWGYLVRNNEGKPPYDPAGTHGITLEQLRDCARAQGVTFRQG